MNTANKITMIRLALIPAFVAVLYIGFDGSNYAAMGIFIAAALTDVADGYIARKKGQVTDFGKFLDPLADKILVFAAILWFVEKDLIPGWAALVVVIREFMVTALRLLAIGKGRVIPAGLSGKIKTLVTIICLAAMFLPLQQWMLYACIAAIIGTTVFSGIDYFIKNKDIMKMGWK